MLYQEKSKKIKMNLILDYSNELFGSEAKILDDCTIYTIDIMRL